MSHFRQPPDRKVFVSAGEASGDLHGAYLVRALKKLDPRLHVTCLGGTTLGESGARILVDNRELALIGFVEVALRSKEIFAAWKKIQHHLQQQRPDLVILIDFPDFNFVLGRYARRLGLRVLYYIAPQVWAWRSGRARSMKRFTDEVAVILPFEPDFFRRYGLSVRYVGHPLMDVLRDVPERESARAQYCSLLQEKSASCFCVGLLPGSRHHEIRRLLPLLLETAHILTNRLSSVVFLLPLASHVERSIIEAAISNHDARQLPITIIDNDAYGAIRACDLILTASGTVTLESTILGTPMIIVYKVPPVEVLLAKWLLKVQHIGLPNLIAGRAVCPELIQERADPTLLAKEALSLLLDHGKRLTQQRELARITAQLGQPGVARRVAELALDLMRR